MGSTFCAHVPPKHEKIHMKAKPNPMVQQKCPLTGSILPISFHLKRACQIQTYQKKEKRPPKAKAYELIRLKKFSFPKTGN
jgi:hypothetical protein